MLPPSYFEPSARQIPDICASCRAIKWGKVPACRVHKNGDVPQPVSPFGRCSAYQRAPKYRKPPEIIY